MKEVVLQRVKDFIEESKMSKNAFAKSLSMDQTTVNNQILGKRSVSIDLVLSFLTNYPNISAEWLMRGEGEMFIQEKTEYADKLSDETEGYSTIRELQDKIVALEAENNVLREMVGLQKNKQREGKSA